MKTTLIFVFVIAFNCISFSQAQMSDLTKLEGKIGEYPVVMDLGYLVGGMSVCMVSGSYFYKSKKVIIDLCSEDGEKFVENLNGDETGYFTLDDWEKKVGQIVTGTWHSMDDSKSYPISLKVMKKSN